MLQYVDVVLYTPFHNSLSLCSVGLLSGRTKRMTKYFMRHPKDDIVEQYSISVSALTKWTGNYVRCQMLKKIRKPKNDKNMVDIWNFVFCSSFLETKILPTLNPSRKYAKKNCLQNKFALNLDKQNLKKNL